MCTIADFFNLLVREISIALQIEKRAIAAAESYHSSLEALDAERSELRRDLLETQHALSEVRARLHCCLRQ